jgi:hypothetical protein
MPSFALSIVRCRALAICVLTGALAVGVSACGSSSSSTTSVASAGAGGGTTGSTYQARLNYAKCMRAHGVNVPDPSANGGPAGGGGGAGGGGFQQLRSSPNFQSASTACAKYRSKAFGLGNFTPAQRAAAQQALVKFAECMRSHNVNVPDPSTTSGGGFGIFRSLASSQRNSPAFKTALTACSSSLPRFGRGGPGGGAPGGGSSA